MYFPSPRFVKLIKCFLYASSYPAQRLNWQLNRRTTARSECIYAEHHKCTVCDRIRRHTNLNMEIIYAAVAAAACDFHFANSVLSQKKAFFFLPVQMSTKIQHLFIRCRLQKLAKKLCENVFPRSVVQELTQWWVPTAPWTLSRSKGWRTRSSRRLGQSGTTRWANWHWNYFGLLPGCVFWRRRKVFSRQWFWSITWGSWRGTPDSSKKTLLYCKGPTPKIFWSFS